MPGCSQLQNPDELALFSVPDLGPLCTYGALEENKGKMPMPHGHNNLMSKFNGGSIDLQATPVVFLLSEASSIIIIALAPSLA